MKPEEPVMKTEFNQDLLSGFRTILLLCVLAHRFEIGGVAV